MRICCAGEVMVELASEAEPAIYRQGLAGDSFNTAIYLAREGLSVDYLTCLGVDRFSDAIIDQLQRENIGCDSIRLLPGRQPGLYIINNDQQGERQFSYWRDHSPAREIFDQAVTLSACQGFYFTGITLAITRSGTHNLKNLLMQLRQDGVAILFDPNYRPQLWQSKAQAKQYYRDILPFCDTVLPTLDDETVLWDIDSVERCAEMYRDYGAKEIVIKGPELVAHVFTDQQHVQRQAEAVSAVDTTGAGDSFNAAYLAARLRGESIESALLAAQTLAAAVVRHRGALLPRQLTA